MGGPPEGLGIMEGTAHQKEDAKSLTTSHSCPLPTARKASHKHHIHAGCRPLSTSTLLLPEQGPQKKPRIVSCGPYKNEKPADEAR